MILSREDYKSKGGVQFFSFCAECWRTNITRGIAKKDLWPMFCLSPRGCAHISTLKERERIVP